MLQTQYFWKRGSVTKWVWGIQKEVVLEAEFRRTSRRGGKGNFPYGKEKKVIQTMKSACVKTPDIKEFRGFSAV